MKEIQSDYVHNFAVQAEQLMYLYEKGTLEDLKNAIFPCIADLAMQPAGVPMKKWHSFRIYYVINWNKLFPLIEAWEYIESPFLLRNQITVEQVHDIALQNLNKQKVLCKKLLFDKDIICLKLDNKMIPSISSSILLMDHIWKKLYLLMKGPFYILPLYRDYIFAVSEKTVCGNYVRLEEIRKEIKRIYSEIAVPFDDTVIFYNGSCFYFTR